MAKTRLVLVVVGAVLALVVLYMGCAVLGLLPLPSFRTVEREDIEPAKPKYRLLADDRLADKNPEFDPALVDSRLFGDAPNNMWEVNASAAVVGLDVPDIRDADEGFLLELYPSYAAAAKALEGRGRTLLPSVNMLDGKAKQFDDGLYAELDSAMTFGKMRAFHDTSTMLKEILGKLDPAGDAYAWVWGGLEVGIEDFLKTVHTRRPDGAQRFIDEFERNEVESKPIGFYTWSDELRRTFRFLRYFQKGWPARQGVPDEIAAVLAANPDIVKQYETLLDFYARLTNPFDALSFKHIADPSNVGKDLARLWKEAGLPPKPDGPTVHLLPYSTSREVVLFNRLFGASGLPEGADLMMEFVKAIRDGRVDLAPKDNSGWYDYQVYALETFLLPERGEESGKLLLTKKYKERMLQAFKALITKRRETHVRHLGRGAARCAPPPSGALKPRLRVEPNPTFFIRTARAYAFLQTYLEATIPEDVMKRLTGRKEGGSRSMPLADELEWIKRFFYGLHLLSCEDIGMRPALLERELQDPDVCMKAASDWLSKWPDDPDFAIDTRVSVPIFVDEINGKTQLWCTLGVRGAKLKAWYAKPPKWRPKAEHDDEPEWQEMKSWNVRPAGFVILVDEFAEVTLKGLRVLSREELRNACDAEGTKEKIVRALSR
jgi:hypothetical protein